MSKRCCGGSSSGSSGEGVSADELCGLVQACIDDGDITLPVDVDSVVDNSDGTVTITATDDDGTETSATICTCPTIFTPADPVDSSTWAAEAPENGIHVVCIDGAVSGVVVGGQLCEVTTNVVSEDADNQIIAGTDGGAFISCDDIKDCVGTDTYTAVDNNDGTTTVTHTAVNGNAITRCYRNCQPVIANGVDVTVVTEDCKFMLNLAENGDTPCVSTADMGQQLGSTTYKLDQDTIPDGVFVTVGAGGHALIEMQDCSEPFADSFDYIICCEDGYETSATVNVEYTPPPIGEIRLEKTIAPEMAEAGETLLIKLEACNEPTATGPITDITVTDQLVANFNPDPDSNGLPTVVNDTAAGSNVLMTGQLITWTFPGPLAPGECEVLEFEVEVVATQAYTPNVATASGNDGVNGPNSTIDSSIDSITSPPSPERVMSVDDSDLNAVSLSSLGSVNCNGILVAADATFCDDWYFQRAYREYDTNCDETARVVVDPTEHFVGKITWGNGSASVDWTGSVITDTTMQSSLEALISVSGQTLTVSKFFADNIYTGEVAQYADTPAGVNVLAGLGYTDTLFNNVRQIEGTEWIFKNSNVTEGPSDECPGAVSTNTVDDQYVRMGVKAVAVSVSRLEGNTLGVTPVNPMAHQFDMADLGSAFRAGATAGGSSGVTTAASSDFYVNADGFTFSGDMTTAGGYTPNTNVPPNIAGIIYRSPGSANNVPDGHYKDILESTNRYGDELIANRISQQPEKIDSNGSYGTPQVSDFWLANSIVGGHLVIRLRHELNTEVRDPDGTALFDYTAGNLAATFSDDDGTFSDSQTIAINSSDTLRVRTDVDTCVPTTKVSEKVRINSNTEISADYTIIPQAPYDGSGLDHKTYYHLIRTF